MKLPTDDLEARELSVILGGAAILLARIANGIPVRNDIEIDAAFDLADRFLTRAELHAEKLTGVSSVKGKTAP
jgi:hypothetical protein